MAGTFERFVNIFDTVFLLIGWIFFLVGFFGLVMVIISYPHGIFRDNVLSFMSGYIYSIMSVFGILLIKFHGKIIVIPR